MSIQSIIEQRPRFKLLIPWTQDELKSRLKAALAQPGAPVIGHDVGHHFFLKIPAEQRHFWTPQLDLEMEDHSEGGTLLRGLVGPSPSVWTRFVFLYAFSGFVCLFGLITGVPQWMLDKPAVGLWVMLLGVAMLLVVYLIAQSGKRLGAMQTGVLRGFLLGVVEEVAIQIDADGVSAHYS